MTPTDFLSLLKSGDLIVVRPGANEPLHVPAHAARQIRPGAGHYKARKPRKLLRSLVAFRKESKKK